MDLYEAVDIIREKAVATRVGERQRLWSAILRQVSTQDSFDNAYAEMLEGFISELLDGVPDDEVLSMWYEEAKPSRRDRRRPEL